MIVVLALLNDGAILSIAYDNVRYKRQPETWNMRLVIGMATVLGVVGPIAAFGLFCLAKDVYHLDHAHLQTLMYLMLSVAGSLTIFLTRTRGPFWSTPRPARILLMAVLGAEAIASMLALFGIFMPSLSWHWVLFVWAYALVWFLLTDRVKLLAYRLLDPVKDQTAVTEAVVPTSGPMPEAGPAAGPPRNVSFAAAVAPFHTDTDPEDPVYHDNDDCPYGQAIKQNANDKSGKDGRRRCEWCAEHAATRGT
jgi:H+-transporting ATPase